MAGWLMPKLICKMMAIISDHILCSQEKENVWMQHETISICTEKDDMNDFGKLKLLCPG
jgi:hypothetical protein